MAAPAAQGLVTDLYQLTMLQAYLEHDMHAPATFELFTRRLPPNRNFLIAAGLDAALDYLEQLRFEDADIDYLESLGRFSRLSFSTICGGSGFRAASTPCARARRSSPTSRF